MCRLIFETEVFIRERLNAWAWPGLHFITYKGCSSFMQQGAKDVPTDPSSVRNPAQVGLMPCCDEHLERSSTCMTTRRTVWQRMDFGDRLSDLNPLRIPGRSHVIRCSWALRGFTIHLARALAGRDHTLIQAKAPRLHKSTHLDDAVSIFTYRLSRETS